MRIGIVNDLALATEVLKRLVASAPDCSVAWTAADGAEAVRKAAADRPDVILMDLVMPVMDGAEATRRIMAESPCPILLVTSSVCGNFNQVYKAMGHGALDAVDTPVMGHGGALQGGDRLLTKLEKLRQVQQFKPRPSQSGLYRPVPTPGLADSSLPLIAAVGASTGGPEALAAVLKALPADFPAAVVVAQHIGAEFAPSLIAWLQGRSALPVRPASEGAEPKAGEVVLAVSDDHLVMRPDRRWGYTAHPVENPFRPSVDVLFASLAAHWPRPGVAAVLTGMGADGGRGLLRLLGGGWRTAAQDQATSVVYGMPKAAAEMGAAQAVLPLPGIGPFIRDVATEVARAQIR
jgi:two-component system, chemotaxis family, response regulator WspF